VGVAYSFGLDDQVALVNQPMMKLPGCEPAIGPADLSYPFVLLRPRHLGIEFHLHWTSHVVAERPLLILRISVNRHERSEKVSDIIKFAWPMHACNDTRSVSSVPNFRLLFLFDS